jgi:hypothetical protein
MTTINQLSVARAQAVAEEAERLFCDASWATVVSTGFRLTRGNRSRQLYVRLCGVPAKQQVRIRVFFERHFEVDGFDDVSVEFL